MGRAPHSDFDLLARLPVVDCADVGVMGPFACVYPSRQPVPARTNGAGHCPRRAGIRSPGASNATAGRSAPRPDGTVTRASDACVHQPAEPEAGPCRTFGPVSLRPLDPGFCRIWRRRPPWFLSYSLKKHVPDYVPSSSCSIDRVDCAEGSVQRAPNRSEWAARRHVSGPNPVPVPVWSLEHEVRT